MLRKFSNLEYKYVINTLKERKKRPQIRKGKSNGGMSKNLTLEENCGRNCRR